MTSKLLFLENQPKKLKKREKQKRVLPRSPPPHPHTNTHLYVEKSDGAHQQPVAG
jgi:hypothetical protein